MDRRGPVGEREAAVHRRDVPFLQPSIALRADCRRELVPLRRDGAAWWRYPDSEALGATQSEERAPAGGVGLRCGGTEQQVRRESDSEALGATQSEERAPASEIEIMEDL